VHGGFSLLDTQFVTEHLKQFGALEIGRQDFHQRLERALAHRADFSAMPKDAAPDEVLGVLA
jgi:leucyl/phenylalanyl-tRNA---protein transferase